MAIKSQGAIVKAESARAATKAITAVSLALPAVVTAVAHGYSTGDMVYLTGIGGVTQLNNRSFAIVVLSADTFSLAGEDTTGSTAYTSGGTAAKLTMTSIGSVSDASGFDGKATEIDVTTLLSAAKEFQVGLQDFGNLNLTLITDNSDAGQALLRTIKTAASTKAFSLTLSDGKISVFMASVMSFPVDVKRDNVVMSSCALRITNAPQWFA